MHDFQLTQVALVGARISAFRDHGFNARSALAMRRIAPDMGGMSLLDLPERPLGELLKSQLPIWIHNILVDTQFPQREQLLMPLRRFEGELHDNREDEVFSAVLSAGFRDQTLDPLHPPASMPMRQRCAMVMGIEPWQEAYRSLEQDLVDLLARHAPEVERWLDSVREPSPAMID